MISKKLLSEVFNENISTDIEIRYAEIHGIKMEWKEVWFNFKSYPLDFVTHKCKEWASKTYYSVISGWNMTHWGGAYSVQVFREPSKILFSQSGLDTEQEAIFRACQYILDNKYL